MGAKIAARRGAGAGAMVALCLFGAPARADDDARKVYTDCLGDRAIELCSETHPAPTGAGERTGSPSFEEVLATCAAERAAFVDLVVARNLAAGRSADFAARRVARHTRRVEGVVRDVYEKCIETAP